MKKHAILLLLVASLGACMPKPPVVAPVRTVTAVNASADVAQALARAFPTLLRDAGIGGEVLIWFFLDEEGIRQETRLRVSSRRP